MNNDDETPVETTEVTDDTAPNAQRSRGGKGRGVRVAVVGTAVALVAGTVGTAVYLNRDTDTPRENWLTTSGMTQEDIEAEYNKIVDEAGEGDGRYATPGEVYPEQVNPLLNVSLGCVLDGGKYDARFHEGMSALGGKNWGWCTVPAASDPLLLSNTRYGCLVDGGSWSDTTGRIPDMDAADTPIVAVPGDDTPQVERVTGTCVLPNQGEPRVKQVINPDIKGFDQAAVNAQCVASKGTVSHPKTDPRYNTMSPLNTVYCEIAGVTAARDRFTLAGFATVCQDSGGTFSDGYRKTETLDGIAAMMGTCVPYVGRVMEQKPPKLDPAVDAQMSDDEALKHTRAACDEVKGIWVRNGRVGACYLEGDPQEVFDRTEALAYGCEEDRGRYTPMIQEVPKMGEVRSGECDRRVDWFNSGG